MNELARMMRALRDDYDLRQDELGKRIGLSRQSIVEIEAGRRYITIKTCCLLHSEFPNFAEAIGWANVNAADQIAAENEADRLKD